MKKKILFLIPTLKVGGAERMIQRIIFGLCQTWDCSVVYLDQEQSVEKIDFPSNVTLIKLPVKKTRYAHFSVLKVIKNMRPDIVFSSWSRSNLLLLSIKWFLPKKTNIVIREPNLPSFSLPVFQQRKIYELLYKILYRKANLIICQSKQMKLELITFFTVPESKLHIIHNMLPIADIQAKADEGNLEIDVYSSDVIACGRLEYQKGFDILIESFVDVIKLNPSARLIIFGEGKERNNLETTIDKFGLQGSVLMPGSIKNPFKYMKRCGVYVSSSRWEGLPNAVLEAMACGANIVASDCPGATNEIIKHGKNGWLVSVNDTNGLSKGINNVFSGEWYLNTISIRESAKQFDVDNILPKYTDLLNQAVKNNYL